MRNQSASPAVTAALAATRTHTLARIVTMPSYQDKEKPPELSSRGLFGKSQRHQALPGGLCASKRELNYFAASSPSFLSSPFLAFLPFFLARFSVFSAAGSSPAEASVVLANGMAKARARRITRVSFIGSDRKSTRLNSSHR